MGEKGEESTQTKCKQARRVGLSRIVPRVFRSQENCCGVLIFSTEVSGADGLEDAVAIA
jgi:hypothetical protein